ncbi:MAG: hypothetical protein R3C19_16945 [Planctomycetaceae bacterium]
MNLSCPAEGVRRLVTWADSPLIPLPLPVDSWWGFGVVLVLLVLFVWVVVRLVSRETDDIDPAEADRQMLTAINELHRRGDLSPEEFRSIKGQLVERLADRPVSDSADSTVEHARGTGEQTSDHLQTEITKDKHSAAATGQPSASGDVRQPEPDGSGQHTPSIPPEKSPDN